MAYSRPANRPRVAAAALCALIVSGCAAGQPVIVQPRSPTQTSDPWPNFAAAIASSRRVGPGPLFRPRPRGRRVQLTLPVDGLRCSTRQAVNAFAHVELFAANHVVTLPAGIGIAPPLQRHGAHVLTGRCAYPLRTLDPTGLVLMGPGRAYTLGELFAVWGQPLSRSAFAGFRAPEHARVSIFIDGMAWRGEPAEAPLASHSQITIELGPYVPPHAHYMFPSLSFAQS